LKLRTLKELQDGKYHDVPIDKTKTVQIFKAVSLILVMFVSLFLLGHKITIQIGIALIGGIGLYLWTSFYLIWYFILCELFKED